MSRAGLLLLITTLSTVAHADSDFLAFVDRNATVPRSPLLVPGTPRSAQQHPSYRFLETSRLIGFPFPYRIELRPPVVPSIIPGELTHFPQIAATDIEESDVLAVSEYHAGRVGFVRYGVFHSNGSRLPVILKAQLSGDPDDTLTEARSAQLLSDLGVGPVFHGIYADQDGRSSIVMNVVPGDFSQRSEVTLQTLEDGDEIARRLIEAGISWLPDFQAHVFRERLVVIDPGPTILGAHPAENASSVSDVIRSTLLKTASPATRVKYLAGLMQADRKGFARLVARYLAAASVSPQPSVRSVVPWGLLRRFVPRKSASRPGGSPAKRSK